MRRFIAALIAMLLLCAGASADQTILMTFAGDVTLGSQEGIRDHEGSLDTFAAREGMDYFLREVQPLFAGDDLTVVNLEGVLADSTRGARRDKSIRFRGPTAMTEILRAGSVEAVNLANNHTLDYGKTGYAATLAALEEANIAAFGTRQVYIFEKGNVRIAFLGLNAADYLRNRDWFRQEIPRLKQEEGVSAVVFTFHAGYEYRPTHSPRQTEYARAAIDAGADLVIMHHPHVVQGMSVYQNRSIFYSLGNFCFGGNKRVRSAPALIVRAEMHFSDEGAYLGQTMHLIPAHISGTQPVSNYQPCLVTGDDAAAVLALVQADTAFPLAPFDESIGCASQPYLPAQP